MNIGDVILEVTNGIDKEIGLLRWQTVKRIVQKHLEAARKELLHTASEERRILANTDLTAAEIGTKVHQEIEESLRRG